jgi:hypothetical protein
MTSADNDASPADLEDFDITVKDREHERDVEYGDKRREQE